MSTTHRVRLQARHRQAVDALADAQQALSLALLDPGRDPHALRVAVDRVRDAELRALALHRALADKREPGND